MAGVSELIPLTLIFSHMDDDQHTHTFSSPNEQPALRIMFDRLTDEKNAIACEATVWVLFGEDEEPEPVVEYYRIPNLLVPAGWQKVAKEAAEASGFQCDWLQAFKDAATKTIRQHRTASMSYKTLERGDPDVVPTPFLIRPLISATGITLWYSKPGAGKSMVALGAAISIATGFPIFGTAPSKVGAVIYVDFEDDAVNHEVRLNAALNDIKWDGDDPTIIHFTVTGSFVDSVRPIKSLIREHEAVLVIIDSVGQARGADPSDGDSTIKIMKWMRSFKVPVLAIDHITKVENKDMTKGKVDAPDAVMAIGSQFSTASARLGWFFQHMTTSTAMHIKFNIHNTKHNHVAKQETMSLDIKFMNNDRGLMTNLEFITWGSQMHYEVSNERNEEAALVVHYRADRPLGTTELARMCGVVRSTLASIHRKSPFWEQVAGSTQYVLTNIGIVQATALISVEEA